MAARGQSDVSLIIRARDEASKALGAITSALDDLQSSQKGVASGAESTATGLTRALGTLADLDRAYSRVAGAADTGAQAFQRQLSALAENQAALESLRRQLTAATAAQEQFASFVGPRTQQQTAKYAAIGAEVSNLNGQIKSLTNTVARQESGLTKSTSDLQALGSAMQTAGAATTFAKSQNEGYVASLEQQARAEERAAQAAQRNASVLRAIHSSQYQDSGKSAQQSASVFNASGLTAYEKTIRAEQERAAAVEETNRKLIERGRLEQALADLDQRRGLSASDTALADQLREEAAAFKVAEAAAEEEAAAIERLRHDLDPLAAIQARAANETRKLAKWQREGKITAQEYAAAEKLVAANADRAAQSLGRQSAGGGKPTLFGLKPYEITNLGYQVNDVVTQLASGTSLTQTLAQQGGQLLQIFPRVGASIVAAFTNPVVIAFVASVGTAVLALKAAGDEAERLRNILGRLSASADGQNYGVAELDAASQALDAYGLSAEDALKAVQTFADKGIAQDKIVAFGEAAQNLADVFGIDLKDAVDKVGDSFSKGYDAIAKLDDAYNFLTAAEREHIRALFDEGRAADARSEAFRIFSDRQEDAAEKMRGPWADATRELSAAWQEFKNLLADAAWVTGISDALGGLAKRVAEIIRQIRGVSTVADIEAKINRIHSEISDLNVRKNLGGDPFGFIQSGIDDYVDQLKELYAERDRLAKQPDPLQGDGDTVVADSEKQKKADKEIHRQAQQRLADERKLSDEKRIQLAIEKARNDAINAGASAAGIAEAARTAEARERAKIEKEITAEAEKRIREGQTALGASKNLIMEREGFRSRAYWDVNAYRVGYGSDTVTNPDGSVARVTATTVTTMTAAVADLERRIKEFQDTIKRQIGGDRFNAFSAQQQAALTSVAYNYGKLPERIIEAVKNGTTEEIGAAIRGLGGDNGGVNRARRNREADIFVSDPNPEIAAFNEAAQKKALEQEQKLHDTIADENAERTRQTQQLQEQQGLIGNALLQKQKEQAIADAIAKKTQEIAEINRKRVEDGLKPIELSAEERAEIEKTTAAYFDLQHAKEAASNERSAVDQPVNDLTALRQQIQQQIQFYQETGQTSLADQLQPQLDAVNAKLQQATTNALAFYQALAGDPTKMAALGLTKEALDAIIQKLQFAQQSSMQWGYVLGVSAQQIAQTFASAATNAVDRFAQAIANGEKATTALKDAFLQFASDFLRSIAQMILQQLFFNAISGFMKSIGLASGAPVPAAHGGGVIAGTMGMSRTVNPAWFATAARYHSGGIAGLAPNEVPAVLQRGEEVLTRDDPRHILNGGAGGDDPTINMKNVVVYDPVEALERALSDKRGEKVVLTWLSANSHAARGALD